MNSVKEIPNFPGYFADKQGNIYSEIIYCNQYIKRIDRINPKKLKCKKDKDGYLEIGLYKNKKRYFKRVHRLVLETFIGPCPLGQEACHNDGNVFNNNLNNLRWDTPKNNIKDKIKHGTNVGNRGNINAKGENNPLSKLHEKDIIEIRNSYNNKIYNQYQLGKLYNISQQQISKIINKKMWGHV